MQVMVVVKMSNEALAGEKVVLGGYGYAEGFGYPTSEPVGTILSVASSGAELEPSTDLSAKVVGVVADSAAVECSVGGPPTKPIVLLGQASVRIIGEISKGQAIVPCEEPGCGVASPDNRGKIFGGLVGYALAGASGDGEKLVPCIVMPK